MSGETPLALEVDDLRLAYRVRGIDRPVLRGVSFSIERGRSYGLVGESGCGKSTVALALVRYLPRNGRVTGGDVHVDGEDVLALRGRGLRDYHARTVSMVYQNPGAALNPGLRIGQQVAEAFTVLGASNREALDRAHAALAKVQIADVGSVMGRYPHQLSGGMQQRVVIAMALAKDPALLILDEPTTGLDATVEAEVLDLVSALQAELNTAVLFISHNLGAISKMWAIFGMRVARRAMVARTSGWSSFGSEAGITLSRTGAKASASSTATQRSGAASSVRAAPAPSVSLAASSGGSGAPALGGRELRRRARTMRPTSTVAVSSASHAWCSASARAASPVSSRSG